MCSCVSYLKKKFNIIGSTSSTGLAKDIPITTKTPFVGAIVITYESASGHAALVTALEGSTIVLEENNYESCRTTYDRKLSIHSPLIKGYVDISNMIR